MSIKKMMKRRLEPLKRWLSAELRDTARTNLFLNGRTASWQVREKKVISSLQDAEFKVSSQWGEDGIIDWLVERAEIPMEAHTFIEFGVEDYREANTRFLLQNRNWRGLILDGSSAMCETIKMDALAWGHHLTARSAFITRENINTLISEAGFSGEIGLLSVDLDGNDYWVWEAIEVVQPILCICEYNAIFGDIHPISTPYDRAFNRTNAHYSNLYFGASIEALRQLGAQKGYRFVGTTSAANNAFFVREDYAQRFVDRSIQSIDASPSLVRESKNEQGELNYLSGLERFRHIAHLGVINTATGQTIKLEDLGAVYSPKWLDQMIGSAR